MSCGSVTAEWIRQGYRSCQARWISPMVRGSGARMTEMLHRLLLGPELVPELNTLSQFEVIYILVGETSVSGSLQRGIKGKKEDMTRGDRNKSSEGLT